MKSALKAMNAGDAAEVAVRQTDRMLRNAEKERAFRESRLTKVNTFCGHLVDVFLIVLCECHCKSPVILFTLFFIVLGIVG